MRNHLARALYLAAAASTLHPAFSSGAALLLGMAIALGPGNPFAAQGRRWAPLFLQASVVGLGAGMNLEAVGSVGLQGIGYTFIGIAATLGTGAVLGRALRVGPNTALLVSSGTAICGGSAIAAVASTIGAKAGEIAVALATVFVLNASALLFFPYLGHALGLDETQFGLWSALSIHDTSSVVGASLQYGPRALEVATTVKLARTLWILPLAALIGIVRIRGSGAARAKKPWFILGFVGASALVTLVPVLQPAGSAVAWGARRALVLTLFLIGGGLTRSTLREVGARPFLQGMLLWALVGVATLSAIRFEWIRL